MGFFQQPPTVTQPNMFTAGLIRDGQSPHLTHGSEDQMCQDQNYEEYHNNWFSCGENLASDNTEHNLEQEISRLRAQNREQEQLIVRLKMQADHAERVALEYKALMERAEATLHTLRMEALTKDMVSYDVREIGGESAMQTD